MDSIALFFKKYCMRSGAQSQQPSTTWCEGAQVMAHYSTQMDVSSQAIGSLWQLGLRSAQGVIPSYVPWPLHGACSIIRVTL